MESSGMLRRVGLEKTDVSEEISHPATKYQLGISSQRASVAIYS
jgi:hypothetical protein